MSLSVLCFCCFIGSICAINVAIVGGGIGGASSAYFLNELFQKTAEPIKIDVYEKEKRFGGRLRTVNVGGKRYEAGGSIIHPKNRYMVQYAEKFGLKQKLPDDGTFGIFDGNQFVFRGSSWSPVLLFQLIWRYGLDVWRVNSYIRRLMSQFSRIYDIQANGHAFTTMENLLEAMDPSFRQMLKITGKDHLTAEGFNFRFLKELGEAAMMANYGGQSLMKSHAFVTSVALAGAESGLWSIDGGNFLIAEAFLNKSSAQLFKQHKVVQFIYRQDTGKIGVKFASTAGTTEHPVHHIENYDYVIVATPLLDRQDDIQFSNFPGTTKPLYPNLGPYHQTVAGFVQGGLAREAFGLDAEAPPDAIISCNQSTFYASIGANSPVTIRDSVTRPRNIKPFPFFAFLFGGDDDDSPCDRRVWKTFSTKALTNAEVNFLFSSVHAQKDIVWQAYPEYSAYPPRLQTASGTPFELMHPNIFYVNAVEWAASAMEMSVIGGRNAALLVANRHRKAIEKIDNPSFVKSRPKSTGGRHSVEL